MTDKLQTAEDADRQHDEAHGERAGLAAQFDRLRQEFHAMKGNLAANTSITLGTADKVDLITATLAKIDVTALVEALQAVQAMKGGVKVLGWIERPAKWIAAVATAVGAIWLAWQKFKGQG